MAGESQRLARDISAVKKSRTGNPHSRNGCTTCKIRRIKCDETRPACVKCTHTGRKCDGYVPKDTRVKALPRPTPASLKNPFLDFSGTRIEHRFLKFFNYHTAPVISGCFDSDFWIELLPQVAQSEPSIQHAMIAVAAVHARLESMVELLDGVDKQDECRRFEIQQYNKALRHLRMHLSDHGITLEVTLMSCVLLICLEFLRGSIEQAILHLQGGMSILQSYHTQSKNSVSVSEERIARKLNDIFFRLRGQGALCARLSPSLEDIKSNSAQVVLDKPFASLDEARSSLDHLLTATFLFIHVSIKSHYTTSLADIDFETINILVEPHTSLSTQLEKWSQNFESFVANNGSVTNSKFFNGCTMLRMLYIIASIWLQVCISPNETAFDEKVQEFSSIVVLASSLTRNPESDLDVEHLSKPSTRGTCSFTFDMGAIAPLYFAAIACRDRKIRRKAISLLHACTPRREGMWDADIMEYVARRVVEIEEVGLNDFVASSANATLAKETFLPPEHERVIDVTIHYSHDSRNEGQKLFSVTYMMKPTFGQDWIFKQEDVALDIDMTYRRTRESTFTKSLTSGTEWAAAAFKVE